jgi:hypothetical protein
MDAMLERASKVHRTAGILKIAAVALLTIATCSAAVEMRGDHPDTYVVQRGDTLWDIAGRFLKRPWLWPEIWQANPQVRNPHLIYPGDVLSLAYLDRMSVQQGPREGAPINAIPLSDVEPFLKNLRVVVALGKIAFDNYLAVLRERGEIRTRAGFTFGHNREFETGPGQPKLLSSYHPSQQNTSTGKLTEQMLLDVFQHARQIIERK